VYRPPSSSQSPPRPPATSFTEHRFPDVTVLPTPFIGPCTQSMSTWVTTSYTRSCTYLVAWSPFHNLPASEVSNVSQAQSQETPTPSNWILQKLGSMPFQTATVTTPIAQVPKPVLRWKGRNKLHRRSRVPKESLDPSHKDISITPDITQRNLYPMLERRSPSPKSIRAEY